jgi:hypothetical protein
MPNAINRFLELIDTESFHIPFSAQWAVLITLPDGLIGEIKNVPNFEDSRWYPGSDIFTELTKQSVFTDEGVGCIFADSVTQIGDGFGVTDADIGDSGTTGGIIPGIYSKNRTGFASKLLKMKFRETSLSFTDFVIRPWIILASHYGRIADKNNVTKSPEITVINFSKGKSPAQIRKSFKYFQCTPYMVDDIEMTYEKDTVMSYSVTWSFERYAIYSDATFSSPISSPNLPSSALRRGNPGAAPVDRPRILDRRPPANAPESPSENTIQIQTDRS